MTIPDVCVELRKLVKPYYGIMAQSTFSNALLRIESGKAKPATIKRYFNLFGYYGSMNSWAIPDEKPEEGWVVKENGVEVKATVHRAGENHLLISINP